MEDLYNKVVSEIGEINKHEKERSALAKKQFLEALHKANATDILKSINEKGFPSTIYIKAIGEEKTINYHDFKIVCSHIFEKGKIILQFSSFDDKIGSDISYLQNMDRFKLLKTKQDEN